MKILWGIQFVSGLLISRMDTTTVQVPIYGEVEKIRHRKKLFKNNHPTASHFDAIIFFMEKLLYGDNWMLSVNILFATYGILKGRLFFQKKRPQNYKHFFLILYQFLFFY